MNPKTFYITYLNCNTTEIHTVAIHMGSYTDCDNARNYFTDIAGAVRMVILSIWDEDDIAKMIDNDIPIPPEVAKHLGYSGNPFGSYEPDEAGAHIDLPPTDNHISFGEDDDIDDPDAGEEWKKLL